MYYVAPVALLKHGYQLFGLSAILGLAQSSIILLESLVQEVGDDSLLLK